MNSICRDIFKAIHEGKWLKIEYCNKEDQITKYWIGIRGLNPCNRTLKVDGLHLGRYTIGEYDKIFIDSIRSSEIVEGSYCPVNHALVQDIAMHPDRYAGVFDNAANLKILNYLELCNRLDTTPYICDYELVRYIDNDSFTGKEYPLSDEQFREIVSHFQYRTDRNKKKSSNLHIQKLALNVLSIHTHKGLYVLAYRSLNLDVKNRVLKPDEDITICTQFTLNGTQESVRRFLDAEEYDLLENFENNLEQIKDAITEHGGARVQVDDLPYIVGLGMDVILDLHKEYKAILDLYDSGRKPAFPIRAFFGDLLERPRRTKAYPIALLNRNVNLDQLLAINNAMKYPLAYIQGPPGTGKTNTIINTITTFCVLQQYTDRQCVRQAADAHLPEETDSISGAAARKYGKSEGGGPVYPKAQGAGAVDQGLRIDSGQAEGRPDGPGKAAIQPAEGVRGDSGLKGAGGDARARHRVSGDGEKRDAPHAVSDGPAGLPDAKD